MAVSLKGTPWELPALRVPKRWPAAPKPHLCRQPFGAFLPPVWVCTSPNGESDLFVGVAFTAGEAFQLWKGQQP